METPIPNIGVCVIVLSKDKKSILMGKRLKGHKAGTYGIPGGRIEGKEKIKDSAIRELAEETSLVPNSIQYLGTIREFSSYNFIHFAFLCDSFTGTPTNAEPEMCEQWRWHPLDSLPKNILPGHKAAIELFQNPNQKLIDIKS